MDLRKEKLLKKEENVLRGLIFVRSRLCGKLFAKINLQENNSCQN